MLHIDEPQSWIEPEQRLTTITLQHGHDRLHFDEPCLIVCRAPLQALKNGDWSAYENVVRFQPTREGWLNAWRLARLLAEANPSRPACVTEDQTFGLIRVYLVGGMVDALIESRGRRVA